MQLLSSSAGEKDHKKLVRDPPLHFITDNRVLCLNSSCFLCLGIDQRDGVDATDGLQTHQLCPRQDDDNAPHWPEIQGGLPSSLLSVSSSHLKVPRILKSVLLLDLLLCYTMKLLTSG